MKLTINSKDLLKAVQTVGACVKPKNTMPILDNLLFNISNNKLTVIADNLEIRTQIETQVECDGSLNTCIPYKLLTDILKGLPSQGLELTFTALNLTIKSSSGLYNIPLVKADEFPNPKELSETQSISFNALEFTEALQKALLFTERENITNFHNALIGINPEDVKIASTDGNVIYEYSLDAQGEAKDILLSREVVKYITQTITNDEQIEINYTDTHILIQLESRLITAIQSQGSFPKYDKIFTSLNPDKFLNIDKDVISSAIKRLYNIAEQNYHTLVFNLKGDLLELSYNNDLLKYNAKETLKCEYKGDDITIGFNANYLMNMVSTLDEDIKMEILQNDKPCLFYAENTRALVAPMKI
jgi:DNA polymerase-3 subunit beta